MKWLLVWLSITSHPKWIALTIEQRGAWITLLCYAAVQEPARWRFRDPQHAALLLKRDGLSDPDGMVASLIDARWLDLTDEGLEMHDHGDWQRYPSEMPEETAERQRRSRASRTVTTGHDRVTSRGEKKGEKNREEKIDRPESPTRSGTGAAPVGSVLEALIRNDLDPEMAAAFTARRGGSAPGDVRS